MFYILFEIIKKKTNIYILRVYKKVYVIILIYLYIKFIWNSNYLALIVVKGIF